jgi:Fur family transcriptional regulator, ferric uptake regulator
MNLKVIQLLEDKNVKPTPMRMLVLEQLLIKKQNLTLTEIENLLYPADRITIYRTLQTFVKNGIAHSIETLNNGVSYAICSENCVTEIHSENHPHFYCEVCKKVTCNNDFVYSVENSTQANYQINKIEVNIKGICPECRRR